MQAAFFGMRTDWTYGPAVLRWALRHIVVMTGVGCHVSGPAAGSRQVWRRPRITMRSDLARHSPKPAAIALNRGLAVKLSFSRLFLSCFYYEREGVTGRLRNTSGVAAAQSPPKNRKMMWAGRQLFYAIIERDKPPRFDRSKKSNSPCTSGSNQVRPQPPKLGSIWAI